MTIRPHTPDDIRAYVTWLTTALQAAGLSAERRGAEVTVHKPGTSHLLAETITCASGEEGRLWWRWSWDKPICPADEVDEAVRLIDQVVSVPLRPEA